MATISTTKDYIETDVKELMDIAIEDQISLTGIDRYSDCADKAHDKILKSRLEYDLDVSYITGIDRISKRFVERLSILSKYDHDEDRKLIFECFFCIDSNFSNLFKSPITAETSLISSHDVFIT